MNVYQAEVLARKRYRDIGIEDVVEFYRCFNSALPLSLFEAAIEFSVIEIVNRPGQLNIRDHRA